MFNFMHYNGILSGGCKEIREHHPSQWPLVSCVLNLVHYSKEARVAIGEQLREKSRGK